MRDVFRRITAMSFLGLWLSAGPVAVWAQNVDTDAAIEVDVEALVARARSVLEADLAAWGEFAFRREVLRERLDERGQVVWSQSYLFRVKPESGGFDEHLIEIDGRAPRPGEVEEHRRAGRFQKHYREAVAARLGNPFGNDLPLQPLLFDQKHRYVGREIVSGVPCHRIAFDARKEPRKVSTSDRLRHAARGSLCLSVNGAHAVEAQVESVRAVGQSVFRLMRLELRVESAPAGEGAAAGPWLPRLFETRSDIKVGWERLRKHNRYEYSGYRRSGERIR